MRAKFRRWALCYDWVHALADRMTGRRLRTVMVEALAGQRGPFMDLFTGTGAVALALAGEFPGATVVALDLSPEMLARARAKGEGMGNLSLVEADALEAPFRSGTFRGVAISFGLHELPPAMREAVLCEAWRVMAPGGKLVVLDYGPAPALWHRLPFYLFLRLTEPKEVFHFIRFPLTPLLQRAGFGQVGEEPCFGRLRRATGVKTNAKALERPHGHLFSPERLDLLDDPERDAWQHPMEVLDSLGITTGMAVADIGAGSGYLTVRLALRVGERGKVYAEDIQEAMIRRLEERRSEEGWKGVEIVLGEVGDPRLPPGSLDLALIVDTYHELSDPAGLLRSIGGALKGTGRLAIIDWVPKEGPPGPPLGERLPEETVRTEIERAGYRLLRSYTFLPHQYVLLFVPAEAP